MAKPAETKPLWGLFGMSWVTVATALICAWWLGALSPCDARINRLCRKGIPWAVKTDASGVCLGRVHTICTRVVIILVLFVCVTNIVLVPVAVVNNVRTICIPGVVTDHHNQHTYHDAAATTTTTTTTTIVTESNNRRAQSSGSGIAAGASNESSENNVSHVNESHVSESNWSPQEVATPNLAYKCDNGDFSRKAVCGVGGCACSMIEELVCNGVAPTEKAVPAATPATTASGGNVTSCTDVPLPLCSINENETETSGSHAMLVFIHFLNSAVTVLTLFMYLLNVFAVLRVPWSQWSRPKLVYKIPYQRFDIVFKKQMGGANEESQSFRLSDKADPAAIARAIFAHDKLPDGVTLMSEEEEGQLAGAFKADSEQAKADREQITRMSKGEAVQVKPITPQPQPAALVQENIDSTRDTV